MNKALSGIGHIWREAMEGTHCWWHDGGPEWAEDDGDWNSFARREALNALQAADQRLYAACLVLDADSQEYAVARRLWDVVADAIKDAKAL